MNGPERIDRRPGQNDAVSGDRRCLDEAPRASIAGPAWPWSPEAGQRASEATVSLTGSGRGAHAFAVGG
jgi:hypothetical protein